MTETPKSFENAFAALVAAQEIMEPLYKGAINPAFKGEGKPKGTSYADFADVCATVREPFAKCGLAHYSRMVRHESGMDWRTIIVHGASGTSIDCDVPLIVDRQNMQGYKSAVTYAKRIGLESLAGLAPEDDDGNAASSAPPPTKPAQQRQNDKPAELLTDVQWGIISDLIGQTNTDAKAFCAHYKIASVKELSADKFDTARNQLNGKLKKIADEIAAAQSGDDANIQY